MKPNLSDVFQKINKEVTISHTAETIKNYETVRDMVYEKLLDTDPAYKTLANGHSLAGSYADRVKVSAPDEFDILLHIKLGDGMVVRADKKKPGNVTINIKAVLDRYNQPSGLHVHKRLKKLVNAEEYLLVPEIHSWFQSIFDKIGINGSFNINGTDFEISYKMQGPAHTLKVKTKPLDFSIDFVPALQMSRELWCAKRKCPKTCPRDTCWDAIPKKNSKDSETNCSNISWQASYAKVEREIITKKHRLKDALRLLKKLRDTQNLHQFKSYFIKTLFLWEVDAQPEDFWKQSLPDVVFHMLHKWLGYVHEGKLPFYWDERYNHLTQIKHHTMHDQLNRVIQRLEKYKKNEPEKIRDIFIEIKEESKKKDDRVQTANASTTTTERTLSNVTETIRNSKSQDDSLENIGKSCNIQ